MKDLISIITPLHNGENYIKETINSVLNQTYLNWELIIIDDCSKDNGPQIVCEYMAIDSRIKLLKNKTNSGPAVSRNYGIKFSKGRFIAFLDSDDLWKPTKLEIQIQFMLDNECQFTFTNYEQITEEGQLLKVVDNLPLKVNYLSTIKSNKIGCLTAIYDVNYFGKVYMENIQKRQDYTLWLKLLKRVEFAFCVPENLASYRIRRGSISSKKFQLVKYHWKIYRDIEKHNFFKSLYFISNYIIVRLFG